MLWHLLAIVLTYLMAASDFDAYYFIFTQKPILHTLLFPAIMLGGIVPIFAPLILLTIGELRKSLEIKNTAFALGQAAILGLVISSVYKAFTGRIPPPHFSSPVAIVDISHGFQFGFLRGGMFWGWPSSHTTVAFAMAVAVCKLYSQKKLGRFTVVLYAFYVGFGVSISIHWFSDFVAGAIIGAVIGAVVGKSFHGRGGGIDRRPADHLQDKA